MKIFPIDNSFYAKITEKTKYLLGGPKMKYLFLSVFVVMILWPILGLLTGDMDFSGMSLFVGGITLGFILRKVTEPEPDPE